MGKGELAPFLQKETVDIEIEGVLDSKSIDKGDFLFHVGSWCEVEIDKSCLILQLIECELIAHCKFTKFKSVVGGFFLAKGEVREPEDLPLIPVVEDFKNRFAVI